MLRIVMDGGGDLPTGWVDEYDIHDLALTRVGDRLVNIGMVHARAPEVARDLLKRVQDTFNWHETIVTELAIGVAANLGPGTVGLVVYPMDEGGLTL